MPEKSGTDAALCSPISAGAAAGASCCPEAGTTAAANVTSRIKCRCAFMSTSPSWFAVPVRLRLPLLLPGAIEISQIGGRLVLPRRHQVSVRAQHVVLFSDLYMVVVLDADDLAPIGLAIGLATVALGHD